LRICALIFAEVVSISSPVAVIYRSLWSGISALRTFISPSDLGFLPQAPLGLAAGSF
jgi:hypothetical protein